MSLKNGKHYLSTKYLDDAVKVIVVGAGGTGSHMVSDLATLHQTMLDLGHPEGLEVTVMDFDEVSTANVGRAKFYESDVGANKAQTLVNRINLCYGYEFKAVSRKFSSENRGYVNADIIIGCVDTRESRREIWSYMAGRGGYWLDIGNGTDDGQVVLGQFPTTQYGAEEVEIDRLPCVVELFSEMLDEKSDPRNGGPSCSRIEALRKQSAFVNKQGALHAVTMLASLFRDGFIDHHATFFNVKSGKSNSLACDPAAWKRFGFDPLLQKKAHLK